MQPAAFAGILALIAAPAAAQDGSTFASRASEHASLAVADLAAAGVLTVAGVVALPLAVVGGASTVGGAVSAGTGEALIDGGGELAKGAGRMLDQAWGAPLRVGDAVVLTPEPAPTLPATPRGMVRP